MVKLLKFFIFIISVLPSVISQKSIACNQSCPGGHFTTVPYPFGFSSGCKLQLNCTSKGDVLIGEFTVQQFNPDVILVNLPAACGRSIETLTQLVSENYAPVSSNAIVMNNCTKQTMNCMIPLTTIKTNMEIVNCRGDQGGDRNVSCYSSDITRMFLDYRNAMRMGCRHLYSGIVTEMTQDSPAISMDIQVIRLGWWLHGACDCSVNAVCRTIVSPVDGSHGHRCRCKSGFFGDGYIGSSGCRSLKENPGGGLIRGGKLRRLILVLGLGVGFVTIAILIILCLKRKTKWRKNAKHNFKAEMFIRDHEFLAPKRYSYAQVAKMTSSFKFKLGQGGFGTVYKGVLGNQNLVAVKVLSELKGDGEDFINEVASVGRTSHVNIVSLIGFCLEGRKKALIYEFMPNGSLERFIYNSGSSNSSQLGWEKLHQIAIGIARGLEYLYRGCSTRILHFDIKPHNILLDNDFCPKISDFGLAKLFREKESKISMSHMRGTPGYIAPELFSRSFGEVSHKSDVYSYGMMILEMAGGRKNVEVGVDHSSEIYFPHWIYKKLELHEEQLELHGIVCDEEDTIATKMIIVGLWCIQTNPLSRPTITRVLEMLEGDLKSLEVPPKPYLSSPPSCVGSQSTESLLHHSSNNN